MGDKHSPMERVLTDLRTSGLDFIPLGDGWFHFEENSSSDLLETYLYLSNEDVDSYMRGMTDNDVSGAFGPDVSLDEARYRLVTLHLEEAVLSGVNPRRVILFDDAALRVFYTTTSEAIPPPGDYEWRTTP